MKAKLDFITNSSSASFILYVTSEATNLDDFNLKWNDFVNHYINTYFYELLPEVKEWRKARKINVEKKEYLEKVIENNEATEYEKYQYNYVYSNIKPSNDLSYQDVMKIMLGEMNTNFISNSVFTVTNNTLMLNDLIEDLPNWMKYLIILNNMGDPKLLKFGIQNVKLEVDKDH